MDELVRGKEDSSLLWDPDSGNRQCQGGLMSWPVNHSAVSTFAYAVSYSHVHLARHEELPTIVHAKSREK